MKQYHPHLLSVFFQSSPGQEMEFKHSITEFTVQAVILRGRQWSFHLTSKVLISWHQCHQVHCQQAQVQDQQPHQDQTSRSVSSDQLQVINISSCGAQQSRAHSHISSLRFTTDQVLKESAQALVSLHCDQEWFREPSAS